MNTYEHIPVLLQEVVSLLQPHSGENFIDATLGGGGYSREILGKIGSGKLLSIDLDSDAVELARRKNLESGIQNWISGDQSWSPTRNEGNASGGSETRNARSARIALLG